MPGMKIDLHVHTRPLSPCSNMEPEEMIREARRIGLDGVCLTEHHRLWDPREVEGLAREGGVRVFQGVEITTDQGDVLVFGLDEELLHVVPVEELRARVQEAGGFMIAAHPFRGFLLFGVSQLRVDVEQACRRPIFRHVDAVEVLNCRLTLEENEMARKVAGRLGLPGLAGSDAHRTEEVGRCITILQKEVDSVEELVAELRSGRFRTETLR